MDNNQFLLLVTKHFAGTITSEENDLLQKILVEDDYYNSKFLLLEQYWNQQNEESFQHSGEIFESVLEKINNSEKPVKHIWSWYRIAAAAIIVGLIITSGLVYTLHYYKSTQPLPAIETTAIPENDIAPGKDKAILTLEDGTKIDLDSLQNHTALASQFQKRNNNELLVSATQEIQYNTLSTPQGGKYKIVLPDGSIVWLNAASSLYFPTAFSGSKREVTLAGEAYFEIAKNEKQPFFVKVKNMEVAVLGTHFNIMAYNNESTINTTLLEGSVKVQQGSRISMLKPGQQSLLDDNGSLKVRSADIEEVMAWKNDMFIFRGYDFDKIMRQIARWYNVTVIYSRKIPAGRYSGEISRNKNVSQVLNILKESGVSFKIESDKIIVER